MKKKIYVVSITLVIFLGSVIVPQNIEVTASGDQGDPGLIHQWIYSKIYNLTHIPFEKISYWYESRYFGTDGELKAAEYITTWMNYIGLENVKTETINATWDKEYEQGDSNYEGALDQARVMKDFYINITIYNETDNWSIVDYKFIM